MSTATLQGPRADCITARPPRPVVAVVVEWRGRIALFKRSQSVGHEGGLWHCITGYLEPGVSPRQQALVELEDEAGLTLQDLAGFESRDPLLISDDGGNPWVVHTFTAVSKRRRLVINDEHDTYRWTVPSKISRFSNRVPWLDNVLQGTLPDASRETEHDLCIVRSPMWLKDTL
ncbi:NUDIX domain-containing protein [Arthrobacter sp. AFG20]|uniref:NUDIX domain-containing protein n=1 Tax=Arthrobacter sp. AFG20 TaxID=1688671 RepID=UPI0015E0ECE4|nr:NUDIX domain-containing protein [Arthrobacter sp. AFG20]